MFAKASTFVGSGRPHTFVKCPSASATRKLRRRGGCRKRFPVDLPRVAAPRLSMPVGLRAAARLVAKGPPKTTSTPSSPFVAGRRQHCGEGHAVENSQFGEIYLPIQRVAVHCGREYGGQHFPTSHRRTRRHSGPIATVRVIRQRAPILP